MSLQTFKKKGIITCHGTNTSGKFNGEQFYVRRGPFGVDENVGKWGSNGFSINGGTRSPGYIGKTYQMSKNGTPFNGQFPLGNGGNHGRYYEAEPVFNMPNVRADTQGNQYKFIKQSVLSNKGMLKTRFKWVNGQYPNFWVQPQAASDNLSDNNSSWLYTTDKAAANICVSDVNNPEKYADNYKKGGASLCSTTTAKYKSYNIMSANALYTKTLHIPETSSQQTLKIQRKCQNPTYNLKPFPFSVSVGKKSGIGSNISGQQNSSNGPPSSILTPIYLTPPDFYWDSK